MGELHLRRTTGLCEFISRNARVKLLKAILSKMSITEVARSVGCSRMTVYRWLDDSAYHPSNEATFRILKLARSVAPEVSRTILGEDAMMFLRCLKVEFPEIAQV